MSSASSFKTCFVRHNPQGVRRFCAMHPGTPVFERCKKDTNCGNDMWGTRRRSVYVCWVQKEILVLAIVAAFIAANTASGAKLR
jgi:hypothetical protein